MSTRLTIADLSPRHQAEVMRQLGNGKPLGVARAQAVRAVEVGVAGLPKTPAVKKPKPKKRAPKPDTLTPFLVQMGLPAPETEHRFHATRRWRFDYAWPEHRVALEIEGGVWTGGRHTRGSGFLGDMEKYNAAGEQGWRVFRVTPTTAQTTETARMLTAALKAA